MITKNSDVVLELNLLDNGIDFILKGIDELFDENHVLKGYSDPVNVSTKRYKYGTLHLFSGFLLLLKERLSRHLPELIFTGKIVEVKKKLANDKMPNTIDLDEALERLETGPRVTFFDDQIKIIKKMQDFRNKFEHYKVSENKYHLWATVSAFLALVDTFLVRELQINIEASADGHELREKIYSLESVWKRIDEQIKRDWYEEAEGKLDAFRPVRAEVLADLKRTYVSEKGAVQMFIECPECSEETFIVDGEYKGICSNEGCNTTHPITQCDRCGVTMTGFYWEINLCDTCQTWEDEQ